MNSMLALRLPEVIGLTILHSLWQITLLWIVLVAVLKLWPKTSSAVRYALAMATLTLSVVTTGATAVYEWQVHASGEEISVMPGVDATQAIHTAYIQVKQTLISSMLDMLNAAAPVLAWFWFAGLAVMGTRFGGSFFYLKRLRAPEHLTAISPDWAQELKRLSTAIGLRGNVTIAMSSHISSPLTLGSISPMILLPAGLLSGLSTAQIEAILVHELYHIKRHDYAVNVAQAFVEVLLFYHPAVWRINTIIREERENCCDDQTLAFCGDAITYARALTQIQETNTFTKPTLAMSATGNSAGNFTNRIKRLFNIYPNPAQARSKGIIAIGVLLVYLSILLAGVNVSTAQQKKPSARAAQLALDDRNNPLSDSIHASEQLLLLDGKEITHQQLLDFVNKKTPEIQAIVQLADTTIKQRHVRLILNMTSKYITQGDTVTFAAVSDKDSSQIATSIDFLAKAGTQHQTLRFYKTRLALSDATPTKSQDSSKTGPATEKPLLVIDGTAIDPSMAETIMTQLDKNSIASVTGYKGQQALNRYGDAAKDGVIELQLKPGASVEEITKKIALQPHVQVFPNATNGPLHISFTPTRNTSPVSIALVDSEGKVVKEITRATYDNVPTTLNLDLTGYKKGIYVLQINIDGTKSQHRVVVE